ncbi:MAG: four helix bundle protein [Flavobacteriales bacterium]|nr:four helix bundle protein [Flavobacteriales bacterium]
MFGSGRRISQSSCTTDFPIPRISGSRAAAACVSISNNIAEGFEQPTTINYLRYLNIARNSSNEVRSMSYLAVRLNYLKDDEGVHLRTECEAISKMLRAMNEKLLANIRQRNNKEPSS